MKKFPLVLTTIVLNVLLVSCSKGHEHTFANSWSNNESSHWHNATCEHTDITKDLENHKYNNDNICEICGYHKEIPHIHTFSEAWSNDESSHWHQATCEHTDLNEGLSSHIDLDGDNICDVCLYEFEIIKEKYVVSFDTNYGSYTEPQVVIEGAKLSRPNDPTRENYAFIGWYDNKSLEGNEFDFSKPISSNLTLYALWGHSISYIDFDGTEYLSSILKLEEKTTKPNDPTREGFSFYAWYLNKNYQGGEFTFGNTLESNITLYSRYAHSATLFDNNDELFDTLLVPENAPFNRPSDPSKDYYDFSGWFVDKERTNRFEFGRPLEANLNLYLNFTPHHYKITYHNIENLSFDNPSEYVYGVGIKNFNNQATDITNKDKFYGWFFEEECMNQITTISSDMHQDIDVYAKRAEKYSIEYKNWPKDVDNDNPTSYTKFDSFTYDLDSFNEYPGFTKITLKEGDNVVTGVSLGTTGNKVITFESEVTTTKVKLDPNGGLLMPNDPFIFIDLCDGNAPRRFSVPTQASGNSVNIYDGNGFFNPTQEGKVFAGYYFDSSYTEPVDEINLNTVKVGSTIYAKWEDANDMGVIPANPDFKVKVNPEDPPIEKHYYAIPHNITVVNINTLLYASTKTTQTVWVYLVKKDNSREQVLYTSSDVSEEEEAVFDIDVSDALYFEIEHRAHSLTESVESAEFYIHISTWRYRNGNLAVTPTDQIIEEEYYYWQELNVTVTKKDVDFLSWINIKNSQAVYFKNPWYLTESEVELRAKFWN